MTGAVNHNLQFVRQDFYKLLLGKLLFFCALALGALTPAEFQKAKQEVYRNYDQAASHYEFAGILCDAGLYESAFFNTQGLRGSATLEFFETHFNRYTRRKLREYPMPQPLKNGSSEAKISRARSGLQVLAAKYPELAAYCAFAEANESRWNSPAAKDIQRIAAGLLKFQNVPQVWDALFFNAVAARYFHKAADDPEKALYFYLKLYFHDPRMNIGEPVDYCIMMLYKRVTQIRSERALLTADRNYTRAVAENLNRRPRSVENLLRQHKKFIHRKQFAELCLLASTSVDIHLRTYALSELAGSDAEQFRERLQGMLTSPDAALRASAVVLIPGLAPRKELYRIAAAFADDEAAIVRLSIDAIVRKYCNEADQQRYRKMVKKSR